MRRTPRSHAWTLMGPMILQTGCIASIKEERLYGAPRPRFDGPADIVAERTRGDATLSATFNGQIVDVFIFRTNLCRDVEVTSRMQDVTLRRSFADRAQETNAAAAMLFGAGAGLLQYSADQINCPSRSTCWSTMISTEYAVLALAAVPVGFAVYNALRVRDGRASAPAAPEVTQTAWRTCSTEPLAGEPIAISVGSVAIERVTDPAGHACVDLSSLWAHLDPQTQARAIVHHAGSRDVAVDLSPPPAHPAP